MSSLKTQTKVGLYWTFFNNFANYGVQFVVSIILARLLSPEDYGITALPAIFIAVAGTLVNSGFGTALVRKPTINDKDLSTAFYYSITVGIVLYSALFFSAEWIADFYNAPILSSVLKFTALGLLFGPISSVQSVQLTRKLDFKTPAKISVACKITTGVIGMAMAYLGYGIWSLVIPGIFSGILDILLLYYFVRWLPIAGWSKESFKYLWNFGNKMLASNLLDTIFNNIYPLVIGKYYSTRDLGMYNRAYGYATLPSVNITNVLQNVTFPVLSKVQDDKETLARNYRKIICVTAYIVFPLMMLLSALARPLILVMITDKWESCIILLQIVCFSLMWYPVHAINLNLLMVKGRSDLFLRLEIYKKILGVIVMIVAIPRGLVFIVSAAVVTSVICLILNTHYTGRFINAGFLTQMKDLFPALSLSLGMWCIIHVINFFIANLYCQIIFGTLAGAVFYLGLSYLLKRPELQEIKYLLSRKA